MSHEDTKRVFANSFVRATGQIGRLFGGLSCVGVLGAAFYLVMFDMEQSDTSMYAILMLIPATLLLGAWLCLTIRCPRCKAKLLWLSVSRRAIGGWLPWLMSLTKCPECGYEPSRPL